MMLLNFSTKKEHLFSQRYLEGYDLHDEEYFSWLHINHHEALPNDDCSSDMEETATSKISVLSQLETQSLSTKPSMCLA